MTCEPSCQDEIRRDVEIFGSLRIYCVYRFPFCEAQSERSADYLEACGRHSIRIYSRNHSNCCSDVGTFFVVVYEGGFVIWSPVLYPVFGQQFIFDSIVIASVIVVDDSYTIRMVHNNIKFNFHSSHIIDCAGHRVSHRGQRSMGSGSANGASTTTAHDIPSNTWLCRRSCVCSAAAATDRRSSNGDA